VSKRKTDTELIAELRLFNHLESAKRMQELVNEVASTRAELDRVISVAVSSSNDAERALREAELL
jgi:hypothetical protein